MKAVFLMVAIATAVSGCVDDNSRSPPGLIVDAKPMITPMRMGQPMITPMQIGPPLGTTEPKQIQAREQSSPKQAQPQPQEMEGSGQPVWEDSASDPRIYVLIDEAARFGFDIPSTQSALIAGRQRDAVTCDGSILALGATKAVSPQVVSECKLAPCPWDQGNLSCRGAHLGFDARGDLQYLQVTLAGKFRFGNDYLNRFERLYGSTTRRKMGSNKEGFLMENEATVNGVVVSSVYLTLFKENEETIMLNFAIR